MNTRDRKIELEWTPEQAKEVAALLIEPGRNNWNLYQAYRDIQAALLAIAEAEED